MFSPAFHHPDCSLWACLYSSRDTWICLRPWTCLLVAPCRPLSGPRAEAELFGPASPGHSLLLWTGQKPLAGGPLNAGLRTDFVPFSLSCPLLFSRLPLPRPALTCPPNSGYTLCAKLCPATCRPGFSGMSCQNRCVEGCECNPGFVLSGLQCVPQSQCGCLDPTVGYLKVSLWHRVEPVCGAEGREAAVGRAAGRDIGAQICFPVSFSSSGMEP